MMCPYRNFEECDWEYCAARMLVKDESKIGYYMMVCALAYNGAPLPSNSKEAPEVE